MVKALTADELIAAYRGRTVLVTGHTGFKGGWLSLWLRLMGARVIGVALPAETTPALFEVARIGEALEHHALDIRDAAALKAVVKKAAPDVVLHLAAQSIVRRSYREPSGTFATNVMGVAHLLDAVRETPSVRATIIVTSDKCYENREWVWGYRENDAMGGSDPYSASKGAAEIVTAAYRRSFFRNGEHGWLASVRAGNVIGGGDWTEDRLVPDIMRAAAANTPVIIRNPISVRPWQHVLEPLGGYLTLGAHLLGGDAARYAEGWNFGPDPKSNVDVRTVTEEIARLWGAGAPRFQYGTPDVQPHEARLLKLDISKAMADLRWQPLFSLERALALTIAWYKTHLAGGADMRALTERQIGDYLAALTAANSDTSRS